MKIFSINGENILMSGPVGDTPLHKKLRLQPGQRALFLNAPKSLYTPLGALLKEITLVDEPSGELDFAIYFALDSVEMAAAIPHILEHLAHDGLLWAAYPKRSSGGKTDLNREVFWEIMRTHDYKAVTQVYIDDTWTAMRFRHLDLIGKK